MKQVTYGYFCQNYPQILRDVAENHASYKVTEIFGKSVIISNGADFEEYMETIDLAKMAENEDQQGDWIEDYKARQTREAAQAPKSPDKR